MAIHQIHIGHDPVEDRLLLRLTTTDDCEVRFWLTRRFTIQLWKLLVHMLKADRVVQQQLDPQNRRAVLELQHEGYARQADYSQQFVERPRRVLLGDAPVLIAKATAKHGKDGIHTLSLLPLQGQGIDVTLDTRLLHVFAQLLREQAAKTDWNLNLALHDTAETDSAPVVRTLN